MDKTIFRYIFRHSLKAQIGDDCEDARRVLADPAFGADRYRPATAVERKKEAAR